MRVTFDANTLDRAARPSRFPKDPNQTAYVKVNTALTARTLRGYFSETIITLEGIQKKDRASVFKSTQLRQEAEKEIVLGDTMTIEMRSVVEQPARHPLHPETNARIIAALAIGMKVLKTRRLGCSPLRTPVGTSSSERHLKNVKDE